MQDLMQMHKRYQKYILYLLSLAVLGWGFTPYKTIFLGWILGTIVSFFSLWNLVRKINKFGQAVVEGKKARSLGMFTRLSLAGLAILIAQRYSEYLQIYSVVVGLMTFYVVIMIDYFIQIIRK